MRKLFYVLAFSIFTLTGISCNSDDDDPVVILPTPNADQFITFGSWRVTLYQEGDNVQTGNFTGYNFVFSSDHTISASNGVNTYGGSWSFDDDDSGSDDFNILFAAPDNFAELTEDWDILESTSTKLRLRHTSGGDGSVDFLTLEKNP